MTEPMAGDPCPDLPARRMSLSARIAWPYGIIRGFLRWLAQACQRHHMHRLSDHMLQDIGLTRADLEQESRTQSWRR